MKLYFTTSLNNRMADDLEFARFILTSLQRYNVKDWGEMCEEDKTLNDWAWKHQKGRIVARYNHVKDGEDIYIITTFMADEKQVELMFCHEY